LFRADANNITYAAFGDALQYWGFYPAPEVGNGDPRIGYLLKL